MQIFSKASKETWKGVAQGTDVLISPNQSLANNQLKKLIKVCLFKTSLLADLHFNTIIANNTIHMYSGITSGRVLDGVDGTLYSKYVGGTCFYHKHNETFSKSPHPVSGFYG